MGDLAQLKLVDFIEAVAAKTPTPGGGSVSAAASAMGAALGIMASRFSKSEELAEPTSRLEEICGKLEELVDADAEAYNLVHSAQGLPKETEEDKTRRTNALQNALAEAAQVPLTGMQLAVDALECLKEMTPNVSKFLISDLGSAAALLEAGLRGCELNVLINVASIKDRKKTNQLKKDSAELAKKGKSQAGHVHRHVKKMYEKK